MNEADAADCIAADILENREPNRHALGALALAILETVEAEPEINSFEVCRRLGFLTYRHQLIAFWTIGRMVFDGILERPIVPLACHKVQPLKVSP